MYDKWNGNNYVHIEVSELYIIQDEIENIKEILNKLEESTVSESNEMTTFQITKSESLVILDIWERFIKRTILKYMLKIQIKFLYILLYSSDIIINYWICIQNGMHYNHYLLNSVGFLYLYLLLVKY